MAEVRPIMPISARFRPISGPLRHKRGVILSNHLWSNPNLAKSPKNFSGNLAKLGFTSTVKGSLYFPQSPLLRNSRSSTSSYIHHQSNFPSSSLVVCPPFRPGISCMGKAHTAMASQSTQPSSIPAAVARCGCSQPTIRTIRASTLTTLRMRRM